MNQATAVTLIVIEGAGLAIMIGIGVAAIIAWRRSKVVVKNVKHKANQYLDVTDEFIARLRKLAED